jgi:hypothetical protein
MKTLKESILNSTRTGKKFVLPKIGGIYKDLEENTEIVINDYCSKDLQVGEFYDHGNIEDLSNKDKQDIFKYKTKEYDTWDTFLDEYKKLNREDIIIFYNIKHIDETGVAKWDTNNFQFTGKFDY